MKGYPYYSIQVRNEQGASDGFVGSKTEVNRWLKEWLDPENLTAEVRGKDDELVGYKDYGRKTIKWIKKED